MPVLPTFTGSGMLEPMVNPTAYNLVQQSMAGGLPVSSPGGGFDGMSLADIVQKLQLSVNTPKFGMNVGPSGGAGKAGGAAVNSQLMQLIAALLQKEKGMSRGGPPRAGESRMQ